jgi:hypothetical protein
MDKDYNVTLAYPLEEMSAMPVPRTCRAAFGTSSEILEIGQDLPLRLWGMLSIIFVAFFLIWMG